METVTEPLPQPVVPANELPAGNPRSEIAVSVVPEVQTTNEIVAASPDLTAPEPAEATKQLGRARRIRGQLGARAATEVIGLGVDAALMGAGSAGVGLLQSVATRETIATAGDVAIFNKFSPHETHEDRRQPSRLRKVGHLAVSMAAAVVAQKYGPDIADHISSSMTHGVGHFAVPLSSKVGAVAGVNSVMARTLIRH